MPAQGKTRLQIVNAVLSRLREATVATTSTTVYSLFIASLVDTVKAEIEQAHQWLALRNTYDLTCVAGTTSYVLTSAGLYSRVLDMWNTTLPQRMKRSTFAVMNERFFGESSVQTGNPTEYILAGFDTNYDLTV